MSSSNPPTEDPTEFNNLQFNPSFFNTDDGAGITQITADGRYLLKKVPDIATAIETFTSGINTNAITSFQPTTNMTIGNNLTTGDIVIGNSDTDTIVEGNLKPTNRIITTGLLAPTSSSSCAIFNNLLTNTIFMGNALQTGYGIQMGSNNGNITMNGKNIQLGTDQTQLIKCIATLKSNTLEPTTGSNLVLGSTASLVVIGNSTTSDVYLGGEAGSNVVVDGDITCNNFRGKNFNLNVKLFTGFSTTSTAGINFFTNSTEAYTAKTLKIGDITNNIIFKAGSLTSTQAIPDLSYDSTLSTTKWVQDTIIFIVQGVVDNILSSSNTFTGNNSFTGDSTCKTQSSISNSTRLASTAFVKTAIAENQTTFLASSPTFSGTLNTATIKATGKLQTNQLANTAGTVNFLQYIDSPTDTLYLLRPTQINTLYSSGILTGSLTCSSILTCNNIQSGATTTDINFGTTNTNNIILGTASKLLKINSETTTQGGDVFFSSAKLNITTTSYDRRDGIAIKSNANNNQLWYVSFFINNNQSIGQIGGNGSAVFYTSNSDMRLKEDIRPMDLTLDKIMALKPSKYKWKATQKEDEGFIAQDVFKVFPEMKCPIPSATNSECDCPVDDNGDPVYYSLDYGRFTPQIIKALQEMKTMYDSKLASLEERLSLLEGKT